MKHLRSLYDLNPDTLREILTRAGELKSQWNRSERNFPLAGRMLGLLFDKPSLRTRASFETAIAQLGGSSMFFSKDEAGLNGREALSDVARVLSSYCDLLAVRTFAQQTIDEIAHWSNCPVINALSDDFHPCQALTDFFTMQELFGEVRGRRLVFVGDGNNVAASLAIGAAMLGVDFVCCAPADYQLPDALFADLRRDYPNSSISASDNPTQAVADADIVYTDVWASMGQESEAAKRKRDFAGWQVDSQLMSRAPRSCRFMHDLPARRGLEVTDEVMDGPQSVVFQQAENRMHLAKGLLAWLLETDVEAG